MTPESRIYVAGHRGLVGSAIVRRLKAEGFHNLVLRTSAELDLTDQAAVDAFLAAERPEYVFLCAAMVGGIHANDTYPADFIARNLMIETNVIDGAYRHGAKKLLFMGSGCIYPRDCAQPIREDALLTGPLEKTNEWYAVAKIAGLKMCQAYRLQHGFDAISVMPANLYGPGDNFDLETAHVLPALLRKFQHAAETGAPTVTVWGSGTPRREFLFIDDLADASLFLMRHYSALEHINIGLGEDITILELCRRLAAVTGFKGEIVHDRDKPDGTPRKLLDSRRLFELGWRPKVSLDEGLRQTHAWFLAHRDSLREVRPA
ncbi:GDP-L-fucose synthase family protein [Roseospirillum parvum]|uniref:GDP-L-fucose synthase n=1 Tax=Roseospirillum parvum TaxID=83401 RepID=A0A1G7TVW5_9PROT|nr:GDP-L-fucose synthase [Roseospirillum parvum]SDG39412.1 GDP-L-fucose synthase [Roseospirillum parvum]